MSRFLTVVAAALLLAGALLGAAAPALAHALLRHAVPAVGGTVRAAPRDVTLTFSEAVEPGLSRIVVRDAAGAEVDAGTAPTEAGVATRLTVGLKPIGPGRYTVEWHATSVDTHKTDGRYSFTVAR